MGGEDAEAVGGDLDARIDAFPPHPGVYLLKDRRGAVIYVGKAKSLRARVRAYLRGGDERSQVRFLVSRIADVETLVTANEKEALILENNLIKQYKPRYNIRLKDDKSYVSVKVTLQDQWPRLYVTRKIVKDGAKYFGPFHAAAAVRQTLDTIRKVFPLRSCSDAVFRNRSRPCLEYQIKRCPAPCCLPVDRGEYDRNLREGMMLLEGRSPQLVRDLRARMEEAADAEQFEEAARVRDQLRALEATVERQQIVTHWGGDQDVFGLYREGGFIEVQILLVRRGKLTGNQAYGFQDLEFPDAEVLGAVLTQFYQGPRYLPDEILVPVDLDDAEIRAEYLSERRGRRLEILRPQRGDKARLLELAQQNARQSFTARRDTGEQRERMASELRERLSLRNAPKRIECFDISNLQGRLIVGSMVTFDEGEPDKNNYRRYKVRTVEGQDDFASMYEVLTRRYARAREQGDLPDLLVVDGGKGQLGVALAALRGLGVTDLDVVALAKERVERAPRAREIERAEDRVYLPGRKNPVVLPRNSTALFLLQRVRDEAHRFAVSFHRALRRKERFRSALDDVPGVGPGRRSALLRHFGSLKRIREASLEDLTAVPGVSPALAAAIRERLGGTDAPAAAKPV